MQVVFVLYAFHCIMLCCHFTLPFSNITGKYNIYAYRCYITLISNDLIIFSKGWFTKIEYMYFNIWLLSILERKRLD